MSGGNVLAAGDDYSIVTGPSANANPDTTSSGTAVIGEVEAMTHDAKSNEYLSSVIALYRRIK